MLAVEQSMGRIRTEPKGPRTIDIDILFFGNEVLDTPELTVPHPAMHQRRFVLEPLAEIAPDGSASGAQADSAGVVGFVAGRFWFSKQAAAQLIYDWMRGNRRHCPVCSNPSFSSMKCGSALYRRISIYC